VNNLENPLKTGCLVLEDGSTFFGIGFGVQGEKVGEICFNTSHTGYQEILTDPSYSGQIITFTFPHIGNVGANDEDIETDGMSALGLITKADVTNPSNFRALSHLGPWMEKNNMIGLSDVDTRALTHRIRDNGAPKGVVAYNEKGEFDIPALQKKAQEWSGLKGLDLAIQVSAKQTYEWDQAGWDLGTGYKTQTSPKHHVVVLDYGVKKNILRQLAEAGCKVTVMHAQSSAADVLAKSPDGIFLSNGPGDPAATGEYAVPVIQELLNSGKPMFGICLGHQMLCLALGGKTEKMALGHRGGNHPVKDLESGKVEITSQNHGFVVDEKSLPANVVRTHMSLFDKTNEGIKLTDKPVFSVQHHPEASPGPQDSNHLFHRFTEMMDAA